ncbi:MAG TPA: hypothetical protein ENJ01_09285 [Gammaproteobacteria bacterium]|nr:hypothetical protein [Gammaproteobacteria bacterium]
MTIAALWLFLLYFGVLWLSFSLAAMMEVYRLHLIHQLCSRLRLARLLALGPLVSVTGLVPIPGAPALFSAAGGGIVLITSTIFSLCLLAGLWLTRR